MSKRRHKPLEQLLPYETIRAAANGDTEAVCAVLRHYEGYIARLSMRRLYDEYGNTYSYVDEAMQRRLEIKLIAGILSFHAA